MKPSVYQLHVLRLAQSGRDCTWVPLVNGKGSQSRTVGRGATVAHCVHAGWLIYDPALKRHVLTEAGHEVLAERERLDALKQAAEKRRSIRFHAHWEKGYRCHGLWLNEPLTGDVLEPRNNHNTPPRLGVVSLGPAGVWDGKSYSWAVDSLSGDAALHEGTAPTLKAARQAVEAHAADVLAAWWRARR